MGLNDILAGSENNKKPNNQSKNTTKIETKKSVQHAFTIRHDVSTKVLLDRIQRVKELTTPNARSISQGSIIREALNLLAKDIDFNKLEKKYSEFLSHITEDEILKK